MDRVIKPHLIAIVGGSGAGKSWLADRLQEAFPPWIARVSLDHFYRDRSHLPPARRGQLNYDHPRSIDWPRFAQFLRETRLGQPTTHPQYDPVTHTRRATEAWWIPQPIVIVDGLWLLLSADIRACFDWSVYVDCAASLRLERRLKRDVAERGRTTDSVTQQFVRSVAPMHERFVEPQRRWAGFVLREPLRPTDLNRVMNHVSSLLDGRNHPGGFGARHASGRTPIHRTKPCLTSL